MIKELFEALPLIVPTYSDKSKQVNFWKTRFWWKL